MKILAIAMISFFVLPIFAQTTGPDKTVSKCSKENKIICMKEGRDFIKKGKNSEAEELFKKCCEFEMASCCIKAGVLAEKKGKISDAQNFYQKACDLNKDKNCKNVKALTGK